MKFVNIEDIITAYNVLYYKYLNTDLPELEEQIK